MFDFYEICVCFSLLFYKTKIRVLVQRFSFLLIRCQTEIDLPPQADVFVSKHHVNLIKHCSFLFLLSKMQKCKSVCKCAPTCALDLIAVARLACMQRRYQFVILPPASQDSFAHFKFQRFEQFKFRTLSEDVGIIFSSTNAGCLERQTFP